MYRSIWYRGQFLEVRERLSSNPLFAIYAYILAERCTRNAQIENAYNIFKELYDAHKNDWGVAKLTDEQIREAATWYVDAYNAIYENMDDDGLASLWSLDQNAQNAIYRLCQGDDPEYVLAQFEVAYLNIGADNTLTDITLESLTFIAGHRLYYFNN